MVGVKWPVEEGMKWCSRSDKGCSQKNPQPISCFWKNKRTKDGLTSCCKSCRAYKIREVRVLPPWKRPVEEGMKWCSRSDKGCSQKNPQPISCFNNSKTMKDGLHPSCKSCRAYKRREERVIPPWKRPVEEGMKWCSRSDKGCSHKNPQPISCFTKNKPKKDGLNPHCKSCHREYYR